MRNQILCTQSAHNDNAIGLLHCTIKMTKFYFRWFSSITTYAKDHDTEYDILTSVAQQRRQLVREIIVRRVHSVHVRYRISSIALCTCSVNLPIEVVIVKHDVTPACPIVTRYNQLETGFLFANTTIKSCSTIQDRLY